MVTSTSRSSSRASSSLRGNRRFARLPDRASGRVAIGAGGATTAAAVSEMFVRAASRRVSGLSSRLTGRGVVVAAARFSGANGDDHVRRDPQVEFFGGDESDAPVAAAGGAAGAGARGAPRNTRGGPGAHPPVNRARGDRQACAPPAPEYRAAGGGGPARPRGGGSAAPAARPGGGLYAPKPPPPPRQAPPPPRQAPAPARAPRLSPAESPPAADVAADAGAAPAAPRRPDRSPVALRDVLMEKAIVLQSYTPASTASCAPRAAAGSNGERSLAVRIEADGREAQWMCHRATCEWTGGSSVSDAKGGRGGVNARRTSNESAMGSNTSVGTGMSRRPGAGAGGRSNFPPESLERVGPGSTTPAAAKWGAWLEARGVSLSVAERNGLASQHVFSPPRGRTWTRWCSRTCATASW